MTKAEKKETSKPTALRVLRCAKTNRFFTGKGWTEDPRQAKRFYDEIAVAQTCVELRLRDVDLVLCAPGTLVEMFSTRMI